MQVWLVGESWVGAEAVASREEAGGLCQELTPAPHIVGLISADGAYIGRWQSHQATRR